MPPTARKPKSDAAEKTTTVDESDAALLRLPPRFVHSSNLSEIYADADDTPVLLPAPPEHAALGLVRIMRADEHAARLRALEAPFPQSQVEKLPKQLRRDDQDRGRCDGSAAYSADGHACGGWHARSMHLDYIGHAGVTLRLLEVDPLWSYRFLNAPNGVPVVNAEGAWIELTVLGMTRLGFGDADGKRGANAIKEVIGDAIRNAAMRFGVGTYLWSKSAESQILRAGGEIDDAPPPRRAEPPTPTQQRAERRQRAEQQSEPPTAAMPDTTAIAYRAQILRAIDSTDPGQQRDGLLRPLRDEIEGLGGLGNVVPLPEPWHEGDVTTATLLDLIMRGRGIRTPSGENAEHDPWATEGAQQ